MTTETTTLAQPRPGTVVDKWGTRCTRATPTSYPLRASCDNCGDPVECSRGTGDWFHPRTKQARCDVTKLDPRVGVTVHARACVTDGKVECVCGLEPDDAAVDRAYDQAVDHQFEIDGGF